MQAGTFIKWYQTQSNAVVDFNTLLNLLNWAQNKLCGPETEICRVTPDPYLDTTRGTFTYVANAALKSSALPVPAGGGIGDVKRVAEIYSRIGPGTVGFNGPNWDRSRFIRQLPYRFVPDELGGRVLAPIDAPDSAGAGQNDCIINWEPFMDPGDTCKWWSVRAYRWPAQLLSGNTILTIPDDFVYDLLFETLTAVIERNAYGRNDYSLQVESEAYKRFFTRYSGITRNSRPRNSPPLNA